MPRVEEITRFYNRDTYFTSSINLPSNKSSRVSKSNDSRRKRLQPGSYNLSLLENQLHGTELTEDLQEEKSSQKRQIELDQENFNDVGRWDIPKTGINFHYQTTRSAVSLSSKPQTTTSTTKSKPQQEDKSQDKIIKIKQSYVTSVRKILSSRRTLNNYMDEIDERFHSVLYGIISKRTVNSFIVPNKKLCSICGDSSPGSCTKCSARVCSVACDVIHKEARCSGY